MGDGQLGAQHKGENIQGQMERKSHCVNKKPCAHPWGPLVCLCTNLIQFALHTIFFYLCILTLPWTQVNKFFLILFWSFQTFLFVMPCSRVSQHPPMHHVGWMVCEQGWYLTLALPIDKMSVYLLCPHSKHQKNPFQSKQSKHFHQRNRLPKWSWF